MSGVIDIVCNLFTPREVKLEQTGLDETFKEQIRMDPKMRKGVTVAQYLKKMDAAGIERSLLIAVRAGDLNVKGSFAIPYKRVYEICKKHPDRFSGLAGIDPSIGVQQLYELDEAVRTMGFVGAHYYPHWFNMAPDDARMYPVYARCVELDIPIMMQVGQNLIYQRDRRLASVGRPICLDPVAIHFPDLRLLGIHLGVPWVDEMIAMAWKHANVFIGGDAYAPKHWPKQIVQYANTYGQDKFLFGTDWPVIDPIRALQDIDELDFRAVPKRKILRDNAIRIFKLGTTGAN